MRVDAESDEKGGDGDTVGDLLHGRASRAKSGVGDVLAAVVVDNDADDGVDDVEQAHGDAHGLLVGAGVTHLGNDTEVGGGSSEREDDRVDGAHSGSEGGVVGDLEVLVPGAGVGGLDRGEVGALLDTDGDSERENGGHDGNEADPAEPRNLAESTDRGKHPPSDGGDGDEDGRAGTVVGGSRRNSVEGSANGKDTRGRDEDHEKNEGDTEVLATNAAADNETGIGNSVHLGVVHLEVTNDGGAVWEGVSRCSFFVCLGNHSDARNRHMTRACPAVRRHSECLVT